MTWVEKTETENISAILTILAFCDWLSAEGFLIARPVSPPLTDRQVVCDVSTHFTKLVAEYRPVDVEASEAEAKRLREYAQETIQQGRRLLQLAKQTRQVSADLRAAARQTGSDSATCGEKKRKQRTYEQKVSATCGAKEWKQ